MICVTDPAFTRLWMHKDISDPPETGIPARGIGNWEERKMRKALVVLVAVLGVAGLVTVGSAHMWGGGPGGTQGYGPGSGWNGGMGPGWMHSGMGPGWMHGSGYYCNGPEGTESAALLPRDEVQKSVETFAGKSFPGYKVGTVERDDYGRPFYTASLTGKDSRFKVQVNAFDGKVIGVYPVEE